MSVDYSARLSEFLPTNQDIEVFASKPLTTRLLNIFERMTTWFRHLYALRNDSETSVLLAAGHSKVIETWILAPLGLLHSSYAALRTVIDISTSYTFYCTHPVEWLSVCEGRANWESRAGIIDWHIHHTSTFKAINKTFSLADALTRDYQELSSYVHGIPITGLPTLKSIERTQISDEDLEKFIHTAQQVDDSLNLLFLIVFHQEIASLSTTDFRVITKEIDRKKLADAGITLPKV